jgi:hypothetical protein
MKLFFDHILCQQSDKDLNFALVSAYFNKEEEEYALNNGWVPFTSWYDYQSNFSTKSFQENKIIWVQVRSSRINIEKFSLNKNQRRLLKNNITTKFIEKNDQLDFEKIYKIYYDYCVFKNFVDVKPLDQFLERYKNDTLKYLCFYEKNELVAFCMVEFLGGQMYSHQFCWNYHNPKLSLGIFSQIQEVELAKSRSIKYVFIGGVSEEYGLYKTKFNGFEYWDGRNWCEDDQTIQILLKKDSDLKTLKELYDFTLEYIKLKNI